MSYGTNCERIMNVLSFLFNALILGVYLGLEGGEVMVKEKVQPHCVVCKKPFKRTDLVHTDTMFSQIQHAKCFIYKGEFIKDSGSYEEIVSKYPDYKKAFIVSDKPITNLAVVSALKKSNNYK
jgi:hypothetical protein